MAEILILKTGAIDAASRQSLLDAGIVPVEVDDPSNVRLLGVEGPELSGGDLLYAALKGCSASANAETAFARAMLALLEKKRAKAEALAAATPSMPARDSKGRFLPPAVEQ